MKVLLIFIYISFATQCVGQAIFGKWKTIDDKSGKGRSIVEIGEHNGKVYGKIVQIFLRPDEPAGSVCTKCSKNDPRYNKKIVGMNILEDMQKNKKEEFWEGKILDPSNGKVYSSKIWLENGNLKVRGYWAFFYRTQVWIRP